MYVVQIIFVRMKQHDTSPMHAHAHFHLHVHVHVHMHVHVHVHVHVHASHMARWCKQIYVQGLWQVFQTRQGAVVPSEAGRVPSAHMHRVRTEVQECEGTAGSSERQGLQLSAPLNV